MARTHVVERMIAQMLFQPNLAGLRTFENAIVGVRRRLDALALQSFQSGLVVSGVGALGAISFAKFETQISRAEGLVGIGREALQGYVEDIKRIGPAASVGPMELARALFYTTSAGLRGKAVTEALDASARASAIGLGEQADVVDLVTSAMNAYAHENLRAIEVTNSLTEAVRLGKLEPASLAIAMGQVLPIASALRVPFSEVAGLMAAMSRTGTDASKASIQLGQVMNTLLRPTNDAEKALASVGLTAQQLRDTAGSGHGGLFRTLELVRDAFDQNNQALVRVFPNIRALRGVFDLLGPSIDTNRWVIQEMADSTGVLDEAMKATERTLEFRFNQSLSRGKILLIEYGETLKGYVIQGLDWFDRLIGKWDDLDEGSRRTIARMTLIGPALLGIAVAAKLLSFALGATVLPATRLVGFVLGALGSSRAKRAVAGVRLLTGAMLGLRIASLGALLPLLAVLPKALLLIGVLVALAVAVRVAWTPVSTFFAGFWRGLQSGSDRILPALERLGESGRRLMQSLGPLGQVMLNIWDLLGGVFEDQSEAGEAWGTRTVDAVVKVTEAVTDLIETLAGVSEFFGSKFDSFGSWIDDTFRGGSKFNRALEDTLEDSAEYLPSSDAKKGPFSRLTEHGRAIIDTLARGVMQSTALDSALAERLQVAPVAASASAVTNHVGGSAYANFELNVTVSSNASDPKEVAREVGEVIGEDVIRPAMEEFAGRVT